MKKMNEQIGRAVLALTMFIGLSCGASRDVQKEDKSLDPAILIEDGPSTIGVFGTGTREDLERRGPRATTMSAELNRLDNGLYRLKLTWSFEGQAPSSWRIRGFQEALDPVTTDLQFNEVVERKSETSEVTQFVSVPLAPGRRYLYEFDAVMTEPLLHGSARLKTVTINLIDAK